MIEIISAYEFINEVNIPDDIKMEVENYLNDYVKHNEINALRCYINYEQGWEGEFFDQWQNIIDIACKLLTQRIITIDPISVKLVVL